MQLTRVLLAKAKPKIIMVMLRSTGSSHQIRSFRERVGDKKEIIHFDPWIQMDCVYKEVKKIRSMKYPMEISAQKNEDTYGIIPEDLLKYEESLKKTGEVRESGEKRKKKKLT